MTRDRDFRHFANAAGLPLQSPDLSVFVCKNADAEILRHGLQDTARRDEERLGASEFDGLLASLTLLVEDGTRSLLLTGAARGDPIVDGLKAAGRLDGGSLEVDVLKVPHHGPRTTSTRISWRR